MGYNNVMAILDTLGKRIRALRHDLGITQIQLADTVGISRPHMNEVENDKVQRVSGDTIAKLAVALQTSTDYLHLLTEEANPPPGVIWEEMPEHIAKFNRLIEALPPHLQEPAIEYLREQLRLFKDVVVLDRGRNGEAAR